MKKLFVILIFSTTSIFCTAQTTWLGVLDAHAVSERYAVQGCIIDITGWIADEIHSNSYDNGQLTLTDKQKSIVQSRDFVNYERGGILPYCYLFHEDDNWTKRVWRTIDINHPDNEIFVRGEVMERKRLYGDSVVVTEHIRPETSLKSICYKNLKAGNVSTYSNEIFTLKSDSAVKDSLDIYWDQVTHFQLKEDWYYEKSTGEFKCHIVGFAPMVMLPDGNLKALFWIYYPELKWVLKNALFTIQSEGSYLWSEYLEQHWYPSKITKTDNHRDHMHSYNTSYYLKDNNTHRTDFDALWNIQRLNEFTNPKKTKMYTGEWIDTLDDGSIVKGKLANGFKYGAWAVYYPNGNEHYWVNYSNNIPHGHYSSWWPDKKLQEEGNFDSGLKEDQWEYYWDNGIPMSKRNYKKGWMDGQQIIYHRNDKKHLEFNYTNFKLNGKFTRWNKKGKVMEMGTFKDNSINGHWEINVALTPLLKDIILANPDFNWGFDTNAAKDGVLSYSLELKHYYHRKCAWDLCIDIIEKSEIR